MNSSIPTVRQIAWISLIPQLIFIGLLVLGWQSLNTRYPFYYGALTYLLLSFSLRTWIPKDHKKGMRHVKQERYLEAIPHFRESYHFFKRYDWIDKYRYLTLLSSSKISYREMALNNMAFCYGQAGNGVKSKEYYEKTLQEFPGSGMAKAALRLLNSLDSPSPSRNSTAIKQ